MVSPAGDGPLEIAGVGWGGGGGRLFSKKFPARETCLNKSYKRLCLKKIHATEEKKNPAVKCALKKIVRGKFFNAPPSGYF